MKPKVKGIWRYATSNKPGNVRHVCHQDGVYLLTNLGKFGIIQVSWIARKACQDYLGFGFFGGLEHGVIVDFPCFYVFDTVSNKVIQLGTAGYWVSVRKVAAVIKFHRHNSIARLKPGLVHSDICRRPRMRLNIGMIGAKNSLCSINCKLLNLVCILLATVISFARVALGVLIGKYTSICP